MEALGTAAYAHMRAAEQPELQDLVAAALEARKDDNAAGGSGETGGSGSGKGRAAKRQRVYEDHKHMSEIAAGIKAGRYHQGTLRCGGVPAVTLRRRFAAGKGHGVCGIGPCCLLADRWLAAAAARVLAAAQASPPQAAFSLLPRPLPVPQGQPLQLV